MELSVRGETVRAVGAHVQVDVSRCDEPVRLIAAHQALTFGALHRVVVALPETGAADPGELHCLAFKHEGQ